MLVSTKQTDRRMAQATAAEFERTARLARRGELVEAQARKIVSDLMARAGGGETLRTVTIAEHFNDWMAAKEANRSAGTATRYAPVVESFLESLGTRAGKPLTALAARDVQAYITALGNRGLSGTTTSLHLTIIRMALNTARRQGLIPTNPAEAVEKPEGEAKERGVFTDAEIGLLLGAADGEWKTLILLGSLTGLRLGDCAKLEWKSVDLSAGVITTIVQKTGQRIIIPMHPGLLAHLEKLAGTETAEPHIMPGMACKQNGGTQGLALGFLALLVKAGVHKEDGQGRRRSFHSFRHGFTSRLENAGVSAELRMKLTGHKTASAHTIYTHLETETPHAAVSKLPGLT